MAEGTVLVVLCHSNIECLTAQSVAAPTPSLGQHPGFHHCEGADTAAAGKAVSEDWLVLSAVPTAPRDDGIQATLCLPGQAKNQEQLDLQSSRATGGSLVPFFFLYPLFLPNICSFI